MQLRYLAILLLSLGLAIAQEAEVIEDVAANDERQLFPSFQGLSWFRPNNFLNNLVQRTTVRRRVGETCEFTADCTAGAPNTLCFNGTCLCNLGYKFNAADGACKPVDSCYSCPTKDSCLGGTDVFCNGTCIENFKAVGVSSKKDTIKSPLWPNDYAASQDTFYCLEGGVGRKVNLHLNWIDLETHCGAKCDYIKIYDGCVARDENLIVLLTGDNSRANECMTSNCNKMLVHFHTNEDTGNKGDQRSGFMGHYREVASSTDQNALCQNCL